MKRVLIVDDEFLVRIGIKSMLDWEANGYVIAGEAANGRDAAEKIKTLHPDIVLTDLMMEPMNGLELIEYCQANHPDIRIVALSNYDEFDKVKTAMKLGASDYLLKLTTKPEELLAILNELSREMDERRSSAQDARELLNKSAGAIRQRVLRMLLEPGLAGKEAIVGELDLVDSACKFDESYAVLLLCVANFFLLDATGEAHSDSMFSVTLENAIDEIARDRFSSQVFAHDRGRYYLVINPASDMDGSRFLELANDCFERVNTCVERYFGMCVLGALSDTVFGPENFAQAAAQCENCLKGCFFRRENRLMTVDLAPQADAGRINLDLSDWSLALSHFRFDDARAALKGAFDDLYDRNGLPASAAREALYEFYRALKADGESSGVAVDGLSDKCGQSLYSAIFKYDLLSAIEDSFFAVLDAYEGQCRAMGLKPLNPDIARVIAMVKSDLARGMTATRAAKLAHMSESHFSRFFKRCMGTGFVDYVNGLRIERAKELLVKTDRRVGDIAACCGIENPNYFSILFKKQTGMTPIEYRNANMKFE